MVSTHWHVTVPLLAWLTWILQTCDSGAAPDEKDKDLRPTLTHIPLRIYPSPFRLGSGAAVPLPWLPLIDSANPTPTTRSSWPSMPSPEPTPLMKAYMLKSTAPTPGPRLWVPPRWLLQAIPAACIAFIWMMMPAGPAAGQPQLTAGNFNYRIPLRGHQSTTTNTAFAPT